MLETLSELWLRGVLVRRIPTVVRSGVTEEKRSPVVWLLGFVSGSRCGAIVGGGLGVHTVCDYKEGGAALAHDFTQQSN